MDIATTASQLPYLNFGGLDLMDQLAQPTPSKRSPTPHSSPPLIPQLPSWCPAMPSFLSDNTKWNEFPLFFDLSKLPDPVALPKSSPRCQEVQLWRPKLSPQSKRQSRFFPPTTSPKPNANLSSLAYKLHESDQGIRDVATQTAETAACIVEPAARAGDAISNDGRDEQSDAYPANLWRILSSPQKGNQNDHHDPYVDNFAYQPTEDKYTTPYHPFHHKFEAVNIPCELDNTEIPFVHGNSLTGHANERATFPVLGSDESAGVLDSLVNMTPGQELLIGLNELVVDQYVEEGYADAVLAALDLPPLSPSPSPESTVPVLTMAVPATYEREGGDEELGNCDAHYKSEQALFEPRSPVIKPTDDDIVDVANFLDIAHSPDCWCKDCNDPPELVRAENMTDDEEWMDFLSLTRSRSPSMSSA